jgi:type II secretory pathway pseudopilin PulG
MNLAPNHGSGRVPRAPRSHAAGYSLLVVIAVMAVMAILALALLPSGIREADAEARWQEEEALKALTAGLRNHILDSRSVPAATTVFSNIAEKIGWEIGMVRTNARGRPRLYLVDPSFRMGSTTASTLPFVQGILGFTNISNLRLLLISSVGEPLPAIISAPGSSAAQVFSMLWHAPEGSQPPGWTWGGNWEDIRIARLSLEPLITRVHLLDYNYTSKMGRFSVDNTNVTRQLPTCDYTTLYFVRTRLGLHSHQSPYPLQAVQVLQDVPLATNGPPYLLAPTFVYEGGQWRGILYKGTDAQKHTGEDLQWAYEIFMSGPANVYQVGSVTQSSLTLSMYHFMSNYVRWTELGFSSTFKQQVLQPSQNAMASQLTTYCDKKASVN